MPEIERKSVFYKGKNLEEMDLQAIINEHPEVVLVDELAHTNVEGSKNKKDGRMYWKSLITGSM
jgi:two-component system sensor histidine kinase KdpD